MFKRLSSIFFLFLIYFNKTDIYSYLFIIFLNFFKKLDHRIKEFVSKKIKETIPDLLSISIDLGNFL